MENKDIIAQLSRKLGRNRADVGKLMDGLKSVMTECCADLNSVSIPGFGTFEPKKKNERVVLNPSNGKRMLIPPKVVLNFKVSNVLKNRLK